jgi:hypothetical protein
MKTICCLLLLTGGFAGFAQNPHTKNELGLNLYGVEIDVDFLGDGAYQSYCFSGLQYKRYIGQHYKIRASGQYFSKAENGIQEYNTTVGFMTYTWSYITHTYETRGGVDRVFFSESKLTPFVFADLAYRQIRGKGLGRSSSGYNGEKTYDIDIKEHYAGVMAGLGIRYRPIPSLYIGIETSIGKYWQMSSGRLGSYSLGYFCPVKTFVFGVNF